MQTLQEHPTQARAVSNHPDLPADKYPSGWQWRTRTDDYEKGAYDVSLDVDDPESKVDPKEALFILSEEYTTEISLQCGKSKKYAMVVPLNYDPTSRFDAALGPEMTDKFKEWIRENIKIIVEAINEAYISYKNFRATIDDGLEGVYEEKPILALIEDMGIHTMNPDSYGITIMFNIRNIFNGDFGINLQYLKDDGGWRIFGVVGLGATLDAGSGFKFQGNWSNFTGNDDGGRVKNWAGQTIAWTAGMSIGPTKYNIIPDLIGSGKASSYGRFVNVFPEKDQKGIWYGRTADFYAGASSKRLLLKTMSVDVDLSLGWSVGFSLDYDEEVKNELKETQIFKDLSE